jgi:hypothetical protein
VRSLRSWSRCCGRLVARAILVLAVQFRNVTDLIHRSVQDQRPWDVFFYSRDRSGERWPAK